VGGPQIRSPVSASKRCTRAGSSTKERLGRDPVADHGVDLLAAQMGEDQRFRPGGLEDADLDRRAARRHEDMFGADAIDHLAPRRGRRRGQFKPVLRHHDRTARPLRRRAFQEIHRRRADEARDEEVPRPVIEVERLAHLFDAAIAHDHDLVGHGHGLDLVMGDIDDRGLEAAVQLLDLHPHLDAQFRVQIGKRLVEEENLRVAHDGTPHGDALALTARKLLGEAVEKLGQVEDLGRPRHLGLDFLLGRALDHERKPMFSATVLCG
jgi:hypothetical protein